MLRNGCLLINGAFVGGACDSSVAKTVVTSPYDGRRVGVAAEGGWPEARAALEAAWDAFREWSNSRIEQRASLLRAIATQVLSHRDELVQLLIDEVGKPKTWAQGEVDRTAMTFELSADACAMMAPRDFTLDFDPRGASYRAIGQRVGIGPVVCITPYNWPLNLAAHKIGPALAAGNTIVLKASPQAALCTLELAALIHDAGCPEGVVNAINCDAEVSERLIQAESCKAVSFTGSPSVGWHIKRMLPERRVLLELGSDAYCIVCGDADVEWAAQRICTSAFGYAGQVCISAQHALVSSEVYERAVDALARHTTAISVGDPADATTVCGPLISDAAADRVADWIAEAVSGGARLLAGGRRDGRIIQPTLLSEVPPECKLACEEVFGPVLTVSRFDGLPQAIRRVNSSAYGIHTSVFTANESAVAEAFRELEVGGLIVNDFPTLRFDNMPYGGRKRSGFGREGVEFAIEELTEWKALVRRMP